jgi:hypothetical protein
LYGQTTGRIQGTVSDVSSGQSLAGVLIRVEALDRSTLSSETGRFVLAGLPAGRHDVRIELVGFKTLELESVVVRASRPTELVLELEPTAVPVAPIRVEADRIPLIEPEVSETRQVVPGAALRELPVTDVQEAVELTTGVSDGHFRGGRVGQETYLVDGLAIKNQVEGATEGQGLQFSPTALSEIEVITGGFGAEYGSALSGVVSYATRRGDPERWNGEARFLTDRLSPEDASIGQATLNLTAGGPLHFLGRGATLFVDLQLQGLQDAEPRARGLTCLQPDDADAAVGAAIEAYASKPATAPLYCPYEQAGLPYQQGDGLIGLLRFDKRLSGRMNLAATLLRNRFQREVYTPDLKYNAGSQLGRSTEAWMGLLVLDHVTQKDGQAINLTARLALQRLDRYLGIVDPTWVRNRSTVLGFGLSDFEFAGEEFVRLPIEQQLDSVVAVPGYQVPGGIEGSPFGGAGEGIFTTTGTSGLAAYSRSDFLGTDLAGEWITESGNSFRGGRLSRRQHPARSAVHDHRRPAGRGFPVRPRLQPRPVGLPGPRRVHRLESERHAAPRVRRGLQELGGSKRVPAQLFARGAATRLPVLHRQHDRGLAPHRRAPPGEPEPGVRTGKRLRARVQPSVRRCRRREPHGLPEELDGPGDG